MEEAMNKHLVERRRLPDRRQPATEGRREEDVDALDKKLDSKFGVLRDRLERFIRRATLGFAVLGIACAVGLFGFGLVLKRETENSDDIQAQRKNFVEQSCKEQNERHDKTYSALVAAAAADEAKRTTEAAKAEVRRRRDVTLGLIDALAPKQDCAKLIEQATETKGKE
jgi:hypothetical protein